MVWVPTLRAESVMVALPPLKVTGEPKVAAVDGELHRAAVVEGARAGRHRGREGHGLTEDRRVQRRSHRGAWCWRC